MSVTDDMARMWRSPRPVVRRLMAAGPREDRSLAFLMAACLLVFLGQLPGLQRQAVLEGGDFTRAATYAFFAWMTIAPLLFYGLAAAGLLVARAFGLRVSGAGARLALFWAHLAAAPAWLLYGLMAGFNGASAGTNAVGAIWIAALAIFWIQGLRVAAEGVSHA